jgi:hypothetical protein
MEIIGGSVWESNPPCPFVTGNTGFEVRERHQSPIHSRVIQYRITHQEDEREMKIDHYSWGKIIIDGNAYTSDVIIFPDRVNASWWRKEGHSLYVEDLKDVIAANPESVVIGTGALGAMKVPKETVEHLESRGISVHVEKTGNAVELFQRLQKGKKVIAALHLTC